MTATACIRAVVVTHRSATTIVDCLERLLATPEASEIVVVDNGSDDDTVARVMPFVDAEPRITLRADPENPGFASACNNGATGCAQPWLAFVNPDCLVEPDTFSRLLAHAHDIPGIGAIGCVQVDSDGAEDAAVRRREPSLRKLLLARGARAALHVASDGTPLQRVDALSGAMLLMPANVFAQIGGFDPGYRLHAEDLDLCRRVRDAGFVIAVANDVRVTHLRGVSSRSRPLWVEWQKHRGLWRYFGKFEAKRTSIPMRALLWCALWLHYLMAAPRALLLARRHR
ncbi:MAG TPA: glycosyltransferase family 2 protein [Xanthomonadaceae bacterium]|jgi:N-acetylglucosaminyl-diphospho-decaprenol L-rhamnosyltransferase|nr:glycosyltransferase family 2 protein [Xanthomonadaceae bacterium]